MDEQGTKSTARLGGFAPESRSLSFVAGTHRASFIHRPPVLIMEFLSLVSQLKESMFIMLTSNASSSDLLMTSKRRAMLPSLPREPLLGCRRQLGLDCGAIRAFTACIACRRQS